MNGNAWRTAARVLAVLVLCMGVPGARASEGIEVTKVLMETGSVTFWRISCSRTEPVSVVATFTQEELVALTVKTPQGDFVLAATPPWGIYRGESEWCGAGGMIPLTEVRRNCTEGLVVTFAIAGGGITVTAPWDELCQPGDHYPPPEPTPVVIPGVGSTPVCVWLRPFPLDVDGDREPEFSLPAPWVTLTPCP